MSRVRFPRLALLVLAAACGSRGEPTPAPAPSPTPITAPPAPAPAPPPPTPEQLLSGLLPAGPEAELARGRCLICHDELYLVQQRLSAEGWKKTVAKMHKFGAPVTDEEATTLATWLASNYTRELPPREGALVERPAAGMPAR